MSGKQSSTNATPAVVPAYRFLCVLDFEATCDDAKEINPQEIIEFPVVVIDTATGAVDDALQFHSYVRPTANPELSKFCNQLTGITQEVVDAAPSWEELFPRFEEWLSALTQADGDCAATGQSAGAGAHSARGDSVLFITCGEWDLKSMLPAQCRLSKSTIPAQMRQWCNIKKACSDHYNRRQVGMAGMLRDLNMKLEGRHHSGIDDSKNIARVVQRMIADGYCPQVTSRAR